MLNDEILSLLKKEIDSNIYAKYFTNFSYDEKASKKSIAVFNVQNIFVKNYINSNYKDLISKILEMLTQFKPEIEIRVFNGENVKNIKTSTTKKNGAKPLLNMAYTFNSFIVGDSNETAFVISTQVAKNQNLYNPLLIRGGVGLGKTHLLNAIGNFALNEGKNVIYLTAEQFMNEYVKSNQIKSMDVFRDTYRNCDYLLIDDIQFLGGKEKLQEEFFHTFNELINKHKQIIMTSDKTPNQIKGLEPRLQSRFEQGMMVEIAKPELITKIKIIEQKCNINQIKMDDEIVRFLASNVTNNIRQIEGLIVRLNAQASMINTDITMQMAQNAIKDIQEDKKIDLNIKNIINFVAKELNIKPSELKLKAKNRQITFAKQVIVYLTKNLTLATMSVIAEELGFKDHTAVSRNIKKINSLISEDANLKAKLDDFANKLKTN